MMNDPQSITITKSSGSAAAECVMPATAILGDKWTPLLIGALSTGHMRFCQLQTAVGNVNPRTLSQRLIFLESQNIIAKKTFAQVPPHTEYCLTQKGIDLLPILEHMKTWSTRYNAVDCTR